MVFRFKKGQSKAKTKTRLQSPLQNTHFLTLPASRKFAKLKANQREVYASVAFSVSSVVCYQRRDLIPEHVCLPQREHGTHRAAMPCPPLHTSESAVLMDSPVLGASYKQSHCYILSLDYVGSLSYQSCILLCVLWTYWLSGQTKI